jgi:catechol 2,3-dioxygenase-like lactoylglutathione lyase family enzyme
LEPKNEEGSKRGAWPSGIGAITLFVEDLTEAKEFYGRAFGLPVMYEDENSAVFKFENTLINLMCAELADRGVELLNGPMDRPWGIRTASFRDPGGHIWEIAH